MQIVSSLRLLIDIFYYCMIIFLGAILIGFMYMWIFDSESMLMYSDVDLRNMTSLGFAMVALWIMTIGLFITTLYHLRKAIIKISNNDIYHFDTSKHLKLSGLSIILYALVKSMGEAVKLYMEEGTMTLISLNFKGIDSFWS